MQHIEQTLREYLPSTLHMSLATCVDNTPRVCEVHFVYDDELNLYFRSKSYRRHSQEMLQNPLVSGNIVQQHALDEKVRGVYFEGAAELMTSEDEREKVAPLFVVRLGKVGDKILDAAKDLEGTQFYKIVVSSFFVFDERETHPGEKFELQRNK